MIRTLVRKSETTHENITNTNNPEGGIHIYYGVDYQ